MKTGTQVQQFGTKSPDSNELGCLANLAWCGGAIGLCTAFFLGGVDPEIKERWANNLKTLDDPTVRDRQENLACIPLSRVTLAGDQVILWTNDNRHVSFPITDICLAAPGADESRVLINQWVRTVEPSDLDKVTGFYAEETEMLLHLAVPDDQGYSVILSRLVEVLQGAQVGRNSEWIQANASRQKALIDELLGADSVEKAVE